MGEINRVNVKIYGSEYTIAGEMSREHILKVAEYVDEKMREIARGLGTASTGSIAVLTAVNATDEYMRREAELEEVKKSKAELEENSEHYVKLWEEAKKNLLQHKSEAEGKAGQHEAVKKQLADKELQCGEYEKKVYELENKITTLQKKNEDLISRLGEVEESKEVDTSAFKELELKCKEMESAYFDLQMENIQLKGEIDRYQKIVD